MNITNRLFTYPVLSDEKDDYKESFFSVDYEQSMQGVNSLRLSFDIAMNCHELEQLIIDGKADYVIHLECSTTAYREVLHSVSKHIEHVIPIGRINGSFDAVAFIILKKNITGFFCTDWVDDFQDITFNLFTGSILAYIFCCAYAPYFWQAIQIRYPEYVVYNQKLHAMLGGID